MPLTVGMVTIDCADPHRLAEFWSAVLGVSVANDHGDFLVLTRPSGGGPAVGLQRVPEQRAGKNRVHLDLGGGPRETEVPRLVELGATVLAEHTLPGLSWTVLADPEGNEFCLAEPTR